MQPRSSATVPGIVIGLAGGFSVGGIETWAVRLAANLAGERQVTLVAYPPPLGVPEKLKCTSPEVNVIRCPSLDLGGVRPKLRDQIRSLLPATLISEGQLSSTYIIILICLKLIQFTSSTLKAGYHSLKTNNLVNHLCQDLLDWVYRLTSDLLNYSYCVIWPNTRTKD